MPYAMARVDEAVERAHHRKDGGRHWTLVWLANRLAFLGLPEEQLTPLLLAYQARVMGGWSK